MIGILLVSHGKMAEGIKDSVKMIVGETPQFKTLSLIAGQDIADLQQHILTESKQLNEGDGVLIFVDLFGASPYNAAVKCLPEWQKAGIKARIITGMSLPMVITAMINRDASNLDNLTKEAIEAGKDNIYDAVNVVENVTQATEDDDY
ncbi:PTS sugar transporter subunit IIA [Orbaceae bacterium ESL0721]|nr:PTS sugar transporter subunit IIA [Orbaceae bacterium ESL0721]